MATTAYRYERAYKSPGRFSPKRADYADTTKVFFVPWLTLACIGVFCAVYALEQHLTAMASGSAVQPTIGVLVAMGGLSRNLLDQGEGYRILAAPFLHANLQHLIGNVLAFLLAGARLERQAGRAWMFCIFAAGALAGSVMSVVLSVPSVVSVGASGAIMAMLAALFFISFRLPDGPSKTRSQRWVLVVLLPALIPLSHSGAVTQVDYACHFGGALLGFALGLLLLLTWPEGKAHPALRPGALLLAVGAVLAFGSAAYGVTQAYPAYEKLALMMPEGLMPQRPVDISARAYNLVSSYPLDPRAHLVVAEADMLRNNAIAAESELRTALSLTDPKVAMVLPSLATIERSLLAHTVLAQGRRAEALAIARDACSAAGVEAAPPTVIENLIKAKLCPDTGERAF
jgi:membrane associated rhomboid family serine protease